MADELIVIVDDEQEITRSYEIFLRKFGHSNYKLFNLPEDCLKSLDDEEPAVVFLDLRMPGISGEELLEEIRGRYCNTSIFIVSGTEEVETAVRCIRNGALDYLVKPIDKDRFHTAIFKGLEVYGIKSELLSIKSGLNVSEDVNLAFQNIITRDKSMSRMFSYIEAVSEGDNPILITGETGTGKDLLAEAAHKCSGRGGEYIPVNVSALDENMFNDTLFGHKKGAFTGADKDRSGLLSKADSGTIFLDEIGDLKESSQIKLLRVIQNREYMQIGSDIPKKTNARIIAATNADLRQKVDEGSFRQDLFYRLSAHTVYIPALRERRDDIEMLFHYFYVRELNNFGLESEDVPADFLSALTSHGFPGNVRELESVITDYVILYKNSKITKSELKNFLSDHNIKPATQKQEDGADFEYQGNFPTFKEMEVILLEEALKRTGGNQSRAASMLGISRQAMNKRIKG